MAHQQHPLLPHQQHPLLPSDRQEFFRDFACCPKPTDGSPVDVKCCRPMGFTSTDGFHVDRRPTVDHVDRRPTVDHVDRRPIVDGAIVDHVDGRPIVDHVDRRPIVDGAIVDHVDGRPIDHVDRSLSVDFLSPGSPSPEPFVGGPSVKHSPPSPDPSVSSRKPSPVVSGFPPRRDRPAHFLAEQWSATDPRIFWLNKRPYWVHRLLGKGGFGEVHEVEMLLPTGLEVEWCKDGGRILADLRMFPNVSSQKIVTKVVPVYGHGRGIM